MLHSLPCNIWSRHKASSPIIQSLINCTCRAATSSGVSLVKEQICDLDDDLCMNKRYLPVGQGG